MLKPAILRDELLTEVEVADELRVTVWCLRRRRERRLPPAVTKIGRLVRYRRSDLESFKRAGRIYAGDL